MYNKRHEHRTLKKHMRIQLIESDSMVSDHVKELYLVELDNGRKIEVLYTSSSFDGYNTWSPEDPNDGSYHSESAEIVEEDSKREFGFELPDIAEKLLGLYESSGKKKVSCTEAPLGAEKKWEE
jgi:hypothetical protein